MKLLCSQAAATLLHTDFPCSYYLFISHWLSAFLFGEVFICRAPQAFPSSTIEPQIMNLSLLTIMLWDSLQMLKNK